MSLDGRLNKLMPSLTAKERAILILRSLKEKTPEDAMWRRTMPPEQTAEFNRYVCLMNACNIYLPLFITVLEQQTQQLYFRFYWLQTMASLGERTWDLARLIPASKRAKAEKLVAGYFPRVELPWDPEEHELSWMNVAGNIDKVIREELVAHWEELRAIDIILDEVAAEFDGEDPLRPIMRGVVEATRARMQGLYSVLSDVEPLELKEPAEETLDYARRYFESGKNLMQKL